MPAVTPNASAKPIPGKPGLPLGTLIARFGPALALFVLLAIGLATEPTFRKPENFQNILWAAAPVGIVAIGMTFVITLGGIDLSVGSLAALVGVCTIQAVNSMAGSGDPTAAHVLVGVAVALGFGTLLGTINGSLISLARIPPFIVTLGTLAAYKSLAEVRAEAGIVSSKGDTYEAIGSGGIPLIYEAGRVAVMIPWPVVVFFAVAAIGQLILSRTTFGRRTIAIGDNETAARYAGIPVKTVRLAVYALSGLTAGLGALMITSYMGSASHSTTGRMWELDAIAAVVIGGTRMSGGKGTVIGTVIGVLLLAVIDNLLVMWGSNPALQGLIKGSIIVAAVLIQRGAR
jgi:ribose transport system permease protein